MVIQGAILYRPLHHYLSVALKLSFYYRSMQWRWGSGTWLTSASRPFIDNAKPTLFCWWNFDKRLIKPAKSFSHKGTFGHSLIIGGSYGKIGANVWQPALALRTGSGLVPPWCLGVAMAFLQSTVPQAMLIADSDDVFSPVCLILPCSLLWVLARGLVKIRARWHLWLTCSVMKQCLACWTLMPWIFWLTIAKCKFSANSILTPHPGWV